MEKACFASAKLDRACFSSVRAEEVQFGGADLTAARLAGAAVSRASFQRGFRALSREGGHGRRCDVMDAA